jgi:hypothetical protein
MRLQVDVRRLVMWYFDDDGVHVSEKGAVSEHLIPPKPPNQDGFREAFEALLENPEFMADGGTLAFGLRHGYPIKQRDLRGVCNILKGSDAVVYQSARGLGFEPTLYMYYDECCDIHEGLVVDKPIRGTFINEDNGDSIRKYIRMAGGIPVRQDGRNFGYRDPYDDGYGSRPLRHITVLRLFTQLV